MSADSSDVFRAPTLRVNRVCCADMDASVGTNREFKSNCFTGKSSLLMNALLLDAQRGGGWGAGWVEERRGEARGVSRDSQQELGRHNINMYGLSNHTHCSVFPPLLPDCLQSVHSHVEPLPKFLFLQ